MRPHAERLFRMRPFRPFLRTVVSLFLAASPFVSAMPQTPGGEPKRAADLIHYGDLVDIDVIGSFEFDWRGTLTQEGFLDGTERFTEPVFALCKTESDVAAEVISRLARYLRDPQVTVRVLDRSKRPQVLVTGAVKAPHRFQLRRNPRLNELLIKTGGVTDHASGEISIFRPVGTACVSEDGGTTFVPRREPVTIKLKITDLLKGLESANPIIESGDIVDVVPAWPVYVIGGVNNPIQLALRSELTVSRAVAAAGGVAKDGVSGTATVFRRSDGRSQVIDVDLAKIEGGAAEDIPLEAYDIVDVPQKGKDKRKFPPVIDDPSASRLSGDQLPLRVID